MKHSDGLLAFVVIIKLVVVLVVLVLRVLAAEIGCPCCLNGLAAPLLRLTASFVLLLHFGLGEEEGGDGAKDATLGWPRLVRERVCQRLQWLAVALLLRLGAWVPFPLRKWLPLRRGV